jgi:hypothetical protein
MEGSSESRLSGTPTSRAVSLCPSMQPDTSMLDTLSRVSNHIAKNEVQDSDKKASPELGATVKGRSVHGSKHHGSANSPEGIYLLFVRNSLIIRCQ